MQDRGGRRKIRASRAKQLDNFRPTVTRTLNNLLDALSGYQLRNRYPRYAAQPGKRHHRITVSTQHIRLHITHRHIQLLCDEGAEPSSLQYTSHTYHTFTCKSTDVVTK